MTREETLVVRFVTAMVDCCPEPLHAAEREYWVRQQHAGTPFFMEVWRKTTMALCCPALNPRLSALSWTLDPAHM